MLRQLNVFLITVIFMVGLIRQSDAAHGNVHGIVDGIDGNRLSIALNKGGAISIRYDRDTYVVFAKTRQKLDPKKIPQGAVVNIVEKDGYAKVLVVEEVPK